tara:strand:- start:2013 stop:3095 length:1083 start_codon:yes stop_codon:yes gene_type:complete
MIKSERRNKLTDLKGMLPSEVADLVKKMGEVDYRADQILDWVYKKGAVKVAEMTNLPKAFRDSLSKIAEISQLRQIKISNSQIDESVKFVFEVDNGRRIESVLISDGSRRTVCLSSQIGCPLDCKFCATGRMGLLGNLSSGEIIDQLLQVIRYATGQGDRVTNVVLMGMGEPLLNYDAVYRAVSLICSEAGLGLGGRKVTLSTAGYVPGIIKLAKSNLNIGLAISLNGTTNEIRDSIMPINRRFKIEDLISAAELFHKIRGYGVTFEYVLIDKITDGVENAKRLRDLLVGIPCKINLIPYNEFDSKREFRRPSKVRLADFYKTLKMYGLGFTIRESRGRDIDAACGQLIQKNSFAEDSNE